MTTSFVGKGSTLTVTQADGLTLVSDLVVQAGGLLDGAGAITGPFTLLNQGTIIGDAPSGGILDINTGTFTNQGTVRALNSSVYIEASVNTPNLSNGTLAGGDWEAYSDLRLLTGLITTDNATIFVAGSFEDFNSAAGTMQPVLNSLSVVGTAGLLILDGPTWAASGSIVDNGTVELSASTISAVGGITISATGLMSTSSPILSPLTVDGTLQMSGTLPTSLTGSGTIEALNGNLELQPGSPYTQTFVDNGLISNARTGGIVTFAGGISGSGAFGINGGSNASLTSGIELPASLTNNVVQFDDTNYGELILDSPSTFTGNIRYVNNNNTIVLKNLIGNSASLVPGGGNTEILTISNNGSPVASLTLVALRTVNRVGNQDYTNATFTATPDLLNNVTTITVSGVVTTICFRAGTRIATSDGDVPVEHLAAGDRVLTHFAGERRIVWIGHRTIDCRRHPDPSTILPVRVAADAFGPGLPRRDLFLSPGHALFVDGVLVPVKCLIDGETICQVDADTVRYFHVELDEHDVLFAEGLGAESYLDTGNRPQFANGGPSVALFPDFSTLTWETMGCAPLMVTGQEVTKAKSTLAERAHQMRVTRNINVSLTPAA
jgi:hypothetical protein